jgi:hypothetical protein
MCVLQCPCGLVVSTARAQVRCIRCGRTLGPCNRLTVPMPPITETETVSQTATRPDGPGTTDNGPNGQGPATLTTYVTLVVIAAARSLFARGDSV